MDSNKAERSSHFSPLVFEGKAGDVFKKNGKLAVVSALTIIGVPYGNLLFIKWLIGNTKSSNDMSFRFTGRVGELFGIFFANVVITFLSNGKWVENLLNLYEIRTVQWWCLLILPVLVFWGLSAVAQFWYVRYLVDNIEDDCGKMLESKIPFIKFVLFNIIYMSSFFTIIGWGWVHKWYISWIIKHVKIRDAELRFVGSGFKILVRVFVMLICCLPILTIPLSVTWFLRWYISSFEIRQKSENSTGYAFSGDLSAISEIPSLTKPPAETLYVDSKIIPASLNVLSPGDPLSQKNTASPITTYVNKIEPSNRLMNRTLVIVLISLICLTSTFYLFEKQEANQLTVDIAQLRHDLTERTLASYRFEEKFDRAEKEKAEAKELVVKMKVNTARIEQEAEALVSSLRAELEKSNSAVEKTFLSIKDKNVTDSLLKKGIKILHDQGSRQNLTELRMGDEDTIVGYLLVNDTSIIFSTPIPDLSEQDCVDFNKDLYIGKLMFDKEVGSFFNNIFLPLAETMKAEEFTQWVLLNIASEIKVIKEIRDRSDKINKNKL